jgi:polycomb protein EED
MEETNKTENSFTLPSLVATWSIPSEGTDDHQFYDVKFCPYFNGEDDYPVFAIVGCREVLICGTRTDYQGLMDMNYILRDQEVLGSEGLPILNTCSWAYIDRADPLLAVSGSGGQIKILDICSGSLLTTLIGHGAGLINDLVTHPIYPWILASASIDESIRIWDLRRWNDKYESPCIIICGQSHGHRQGLLSIAWHISGRYIVSGAHDNAVCLWTIPDLSDASDFWVSISPAARKSKSEAVHVVQYPHFVTAAVHSDYVDCVCFFGDMILSKAASDPEAKNEIVLWEITGFDSKLPPPSPDSAPKTQAYKETRSSFNCHQENPHSNSTAASSSDFPLWTQHLTFSLPSTPYFYQRFGLLTPSSSHPTLHSVLTCGTASAQILTWDLTRLRLGHTFSQPTLPLGPRPKHETYIEHTKKHSKKSVPPLRNSTPLRHPLGSTSSFTPDPSSPAPQSHPDRELYPLSSPFTPLKAHKTIKLPLDRDARTTFHAVSWSACGRFCVVVGEGYVFEVEEKKGKGKAKGKADGGFNTKTAQAALLARWV